MRLQKSSVPKLINVLPLKTVEKHAELSIKLDTALNTVDINDDIESSWKALHDATHSVSVKVLGHSVCKHQDWFNDNNTDVQQLIDKMHSSHSTWKNDKGSSRKENVYKKCRGQVQHALRQMKEAYWSFKAMNSKKLQTERILKRFMMASRKCIVLKSMVLLLFFHQIERHC
uniref:Uncharacterized protein n=1 Tax=Octopus bimaculoides TaxID=37653 RepID=A0A0L8GZK8_OCTBM